MRFLRNSDYVRLIQSDELTTILSTASEAGYDSTQLLVDLENGAIEEVTSYLSARYDTPRIFTDTPIFDPAKTYYGQQRVQYHEAAFSAATVYTTGQRVSQAGSIYSSTAGSAAHAFNAAEWTFICLDYALFYVTTPYTEFQEFTNYTKGTQVWFKDNYVYTALQNTNGNSLNNAVYSNYGADNVSNNIANSQDFLVPAQQVDNGSYWSKSVSPYSVTAGTLPTVGAKWTAGDNRSQLLIEHIIDIVLLKLFSTVVPRSIPELRILRYNGNDVNQNGGAIGWLKKVAGGGIQANLYNIYPQQGMAMVFGSSVPKQINTY